MPDSRLGFQVRDPQDTDLEAGTLGLASGIIDVSEGTFLASDEGRRARQFTGNKLILPRRTASPTLHRVNRHPNPAEIQTPPMAAAEGLKPLAGGP